MLRCHGIGVKDHTSLSVFPTQVHFESPCPPEQCWKVMDPKGLPNILEENQSQVWLLTQIICCFSICKDKPQGNYYKYYLL